MSRLAVGLVAPTGPPKIFCHINFIGTDWYIGDSGPGQLGPVALAEAKVFSYPEAEVLCPERMFLGLYVKLQTCRIIPTV